MNFRPQDLVGKTVYRGSSYAPTRGQNNPQGYINRELNGPNWKPDKVAGTNYGQLVSSAAHARNLARRGINNKKQGPFGGVSQFGFTGRSETRSGLAKQALDRMLSQQSPIGERNTNPIPPWQPPSNDSSQVTPAGLPVRPWLNIDNLGRITLPLKSRRLFKAKQQAQEDFIAQILARGIRNG